MSKYCLTKILLAGCLLIAFSSKAQLPACNIIYGKTYSIVAPDTIFNYNPGLPVSSTNPIANTIKIPDGSYGLTVSPVLGSSITTLTFYSIDSASGNYIYYNPSTSAWVNTGHSTGSAPAVNIAAGGGYIYSLVGATGQVYKYDGTGSGTLLTTVSGFSSAAGAAPYDLLADCEGNWYVFNQTGSTPFFRQYSSSGTLVKSWVYDNPFGLTVSSGAGFAIFGDKLFTDDRIIGGVASYQLGFDTLTLLSTTSVGTNFNDDLGSCAGAILTKPEILITESANNVCLGSSVNFTSKTLGGGSSPTYKWFVNGIAAGSTGDSYTYVPANGDKVSCIMTSSSPCAVVPNDTSNIVTMIVVTTVPAPGVVSPVNYCLSSTAAPLTASGTSLKWYTAASGGTGSTTAPTPSTATAGATTYYVTQSLSSCESIRVPIVVNVNPGDTPAKVITPVNYCLGGTATVLTATGTALKWYTAATGGTGTSTAPIPSTTTVGSTTYYVTQTLSGCESYRVGLTVIVNPLPAAPAVISPVNYCQSATAAALTASGTTLKWYTAATGGTGSSTAPVPATGTVAVLNYYVSQTNTLGCESPRANITVNVTTTPAAPAAINPVELCLGVPATALTAIGSSLKWYTVATGGTGSTTAPTPSTTTLGSTNHYVSQTCPLTSVEGPRTTIAVNVNPLPLIAIGSTGTSGLYICRSSTLTLKANAPTAIAWQWDKAPTPIAGATTDSLIVALAGNIGVTVTDAKGCKARQQVLVRQDSTSPSILSPVAASICQEGSVLLTASPGFILHKFQWMKDGLLILPSTPTINLRNVNTTGNYQVRVTNLVGCIDTTNICVVTYYPTPIKPTIINADPLLEVPNIYGYYQWFKNNKFIVGANAHTYTVTSIGKYHVQVTDENGCLNYSDTVNITNTTGIQNAGIGGKLKIYPNPASNQVHIEAPFKVNVRVMDVVGRIVFNEKAVNTVELSNFADGTYLFCITDENDKLITVEKITKSSNSQ